MPRRLAPRWASICVIGGGVAAFAANQAVGVTLPVHLTEQLQQSANAVGLVSASGTVGVIAGRWLSGFLTERVGPARLGTLALVATAGTGFGYVLGEHSVLALAVTRLLHGVMFAWATTALLVAMTARADDRARSRAIAGANLAMPLSLAVFPVAAIELLDASLPLVVAATSSGAAIGGLLFLRAHRGTGPMPNPPAPPVTTSATDGGAAAQGTRPGTVPGLPGGVLAAAAVLGAADAAALDFLPVFAVKHAIPGYGWSFTTFALATVITLALIGQGRGGPMRRAAVAGLLTAATALAVWGHATNLPVLLGVLVLYGCGFAAAQTGVSALAADIDPAQQGRLLATVLLAFDVGRGCGVYLIGLGIDEVGFPATLGALALLMMIAAGRLLVPASSPPLRQ